jgi:hypothetical protein
VALRLDRSEKLAKNCAKFVGGELNNGAKALVNIAKSGDQLTVNFSVVDGGVRGTLKAIEQGLVAAGKEAGAKTARVVASNPNEGMTNFLIRKGFTEIVKDGKGTGQWEKIVRVQ